MVTADCPEEMVRLAHRVADAACEVHRRHWRRAVGVSLKPDGSYVTEIDTQCEAVVREVLAREAPGHGVIGEEFGRERPEAEFVWICDPVDGTADLVAELPMFGFLLGLAWQGRFVLGLLEQPILRDRWLGADGHGTRLNGERVRTRPCERLGEAVVNTLGSESFARAQAVRMARVREAAREVISGGSSYAYGLVARGTLDLLLSANNALHDYAALVPILANAGGVVTDWRGQPLDFSSSGEFILAGDARLIPPTLALLDF